MDASAKKILVVDDEDIVREACSELLESNGFCVDAAVNGADALDKLKSGDYDLVVLDINMPNMDGIDFFTRAEAVYPGFKEKVLFITGDVSGEMDALKVFLNINRNVLKKPFTKDVFMSSVRGILQKE
ncbi:MAG: response regulator [Deltaproteobacteria bacterium]